MKEKSSGKEQAIVSKVAETWTQWRDNKTVNYLKIAM